MRCLNPGLKLITSPKNTVQTEVFAGRGIRWARGGGGGTAAETQGPAFFWDFVLSWWLCCGSSTGGLRCGALVVVKGLLLLRLLLLLLLLLLLPSVGWVLAEESYARLQVESNSPVSTLSVAQSTAAPGGTTPWQEQATDRQRLPP